MDTELVEQLISDPIGYATQLDLKDLEALVLTLRDYYYNTGTELVPDLVYDQIEELLRERSPRSKVLGAIGSQVRSTEGAVSLPLSMPSLNKAKAGTGVLEKWLAKYGGNGLKETGIVVSDKLDGISMMLYISDGKPSLYTRGNGLEGQLVSHLLKYLQFGQFKVNDKRSESDQVLAVRGELMISKSTWDRKYASKYPNVRNFISGLVNAKHPEISILRDLEFVAYQLMMPRVRAGDQMKFLESLGFKVVNYSLMGKMTWSRSGNVEEYFSELLRKRRKEGKYQIDGLVLVDHSQVYDLGTPGENPKHAIAFKNQDEDQTAQTEVIRVVWKASKRYLLKPTVEIKPVFLSGGMLSRATGHYAKFIWDNKIGPGAIVTIVRSGEVIPYILSVDQEASEPDMPEVDYTWDEGGYDIKIAEQNDQVSLSILSHLVKKLKIDHLGPGTLKKVVEMGIKSPAEVLAMKLSDWRKVPGLGKNAEKINSSLRKMEREGVQMAQLMDATSIFGSGIGEKKLQLVLDQIPNLLEEYQIDDRDSLLGEMIRIKGVEEKTAQKVLDGLGEFLDFLQKVPQISIIDKEDSAESEYTSYDEEESSEIRGIRVIFTGVRDKELEKEIKRQGGQVVAGIAKTVPSSEQLVVAKDSAGSSGKLKEARSKGIRIVDLEGLKAILGVD